MYVCMHVCIMDGMSCTHMGSPQPQLSLLYRMDPKVAPIIEPKNRVM